MSLRLTLRTLLAYLDDTLEPLQTKSMGEKTHDSEVAQQLIERIKKVTRKRNLPTPSIEGGEGIADDPNVIAEYLDNVLDTELLQQLESIAVEPDTYPNSDAVLAELAACHQILTLVLGEPARVPPSAIQRMYRLVKGRESIPYRKPSVANSVTGVDADEHAAEVFDTDEAYLMALPIYRRQESWQRRLTPFAALAGLLIALGISIWMVLPDKVANTTTIAFEKTTPVVAVLPTKKGNEVVPPIEKLDPPKKDPKIDPTMPMLKVDPPMVDPMPMPKVDPKVDPPKQPLVPPVVEPDNRREVVGQFVSENNVLVSRPNEKALWKRALLTEPESNIATRDEIVCLPGYHNEVQLHSGVRLLLWGNLLEFVPLPLLETRVQLHAPAPGIAADFTLGLGRVFITTRKGAKPLTVRVRFLKEVWDITLADDQSEVVLDHFSQYPPGVPFSKEQGGEAPLVTMYAGVLKGKASVRIGEQEFADLAAPTVLIWNNKGDGKVTPDKLTEIPPGWSKQIPNDATAREFEAALLNLSKDLRRDVQLDVALAELISGEMVKSSQRMLAVYCLQATDSLPTLIDALGDATFGEVRFAAVASLRHWCNSDPANDLILHKLLVERKGYSERQADVVLQLLHTFSARDVQDPAIYGALIEFLSHEKTAVRELAWFHLSQLDAEGARDPKLRFSPVLSEEMRAGIVAAWKRRIPEGKLPPRPMPMRPN